MNRSVWLTLNLGLILVAATAWAGQPVDASPQPVPAATYSQFACAGFISPDRLSASIRVFNGADNELFEPLHDFSQGDYVFLRRRDHQPFHAGEAYSLLRLESDMMLSSAWESGKLENQILPPSSDYSGQRSRIQKLGYAYDRTGLVRVVRVTPQGAIAKVLFTCDGINAHDIAVAYEPEPVPEYIPTRRLSPFSAPNGKRTGLIVGAEDASTYLAEGSIAFLNIGRAQGVAPGQKYRVYAISRDNVEMGLRGLVPPPQTPRETVGELVILRVQDKSAVGIVVKSLREIAVGDGIELE